MKRILLLLITVLGVPAAQARGVYAGLGLNFLAGAGLIAGVQAGGTVTEQFGMRGVFASNFDTLLVSTPSTKK